MPKLPDPEVTGAEYRKTATIHAVQVNEPFTVETLEGRMNGNAGDYLAKGILGELWPIKKEVFEKTYEKIPVNHLLNLNKAIAARMPLKLRYLIENAHDKVFMDRLRAQQHPHKCRLIRILYADMYWLNTKRGIQEGEK